MCGIAGFVYLDGRPQDPGSDHRVLEDMGLAIQHRGPDDTQIMQWGSVGFVFKRLSIVDVDGGRQPFETPDGRVCAMVNGEIYNHREIRSELSGRHSLRSGSDCEVVPYRYLDCDLDLFDAVNGMFAVALLDRQKRRVLLARDRLGIKPLFYCVVEQASVLVFASELKGLFAHPAVPREFDWGVALSRSYEMDARPRELASFFRGIEKLPAGSYLDLSLADGGYHVKPYWSLHRQEDTSLKAQDCVVRFRELLTESVSLRLMADVEFGLFLSGGIDSAAIAALGARQADFPTFSVLSQATKASGDAQASVAVARHLGLKNHQVQFDHPETLFAPDDWRRILWTCEFFEMNAEQFYKYFLHAFAKQRYPGLKVMLLGQGSDEFSFGYISRLLESDGSSRSDQWQALGKELRSRDCWRAAMEAGWTLTYGDLIRQGVIDLGPLCEEASNRAAGSCWDLYAGMFRSNLDHHLWHEDRTSSAHAIENRVPFLDHRLIEFIASIPEALHPELLMDKQLLRRACDGLLPETIVNRPKGYFFYGAEEHKAYAMLYRLLMADNAQLLEQSISGAERSGGVLNGEALRAYAAGVGSNPQLQDMPRLISLVNMGLLADMASTLRVPDPRSTLPVYEEVISAPSPKRSAGAGGGEELVVTLCAEASLTEVRRDATPSMKAGSWWIAIDGNPKYPLSSPAWIEFLGSLDGNRTVAQIIAEKRLNRARIWRLLEEALSTGVLIEVSAKDGLRR